MRRIVLAVFFLSGLSSLALEILWTRMLTLVFGGTSLAVVSVLTAFMAGLALGSLVGGRLADRLRRPVLAYAVMEGLIGLWGLMVPFLIAALPMLYRAVAPEMSGTTLALFRFGLALLILLPPTTLMGATLPVLSRYFAQEREHIGHNVGLLYTVNTFGAVVGCFSTGFLLLPSFGVSTTVLLLAGMNVVIALAMGLPGLSLEIEPEPEVFVPQTQDTEDDSFEELAQLRPRWSERKLVLWMFGITGFLAMVCQVGWTRVLAMVIGSSIYAFSLILTVFLIGLTAGAALGSWLVDRHITPAYGLVWSFFLSAVMIWGGVLVMDKLPYTFFIMTKGSSLTPWSLFGIKALLSGILILLPTLFMGMIFPFVIQGYFQDNDPIGRTVGRVYAVNTMGSIVGSFCAGFVVIPLLTIQGALGLAIVTYCVLGVTLVLLREQRTPSSKPVVAMGVAFVIVFGALFLTPRWDTRNLSLGLFRISVLKRTKKQHFGMVTPTVYYKEGLSATVSVHKSGSHVALKVNGKTDASSGGDMPTQILSGLLPVTFHGNAKDVLVIGWGSGVTVGAVLQTPVNKVTAVEIEQAVLEGAKHFGFVNHKAWTHPKLDLRTNDGRNFLASTRKKFDVIISEPSNPWMSGVSALFTQQFFKLVKPRLKKDGILCQWVQLYELSPNNIKALLNTIRSVFPYVYLFSVTYHSNDTLMIGSMKPLRFDLKLLQKAFDHKKTRAEYLRAGVVSPIDILPRLLADNLDLKRLVKGAQLNTDDNALLEFTAPIELLTYVQSDSSLVILKKLGRDWNRYRRLFQIPALKKSAAVANKARFYVDLALAQFRYGNHKASAHFENLAHKLAPTLPELLKLKRMKKILLKGDKLFAKSILRRRIPRLFRRRTRCWSPLGDMIVDARSVRAFTKRSRMDPELRILSAFLLFEKKQKDDGLEALAPFFKNHALLRKYPGTYYILGQFFRMKRSWAEAVWFTQLYLKERPADDKVCDFTD